MKTKVFVIVLSVCTFLCLQSIAQTGKTVKTETFGVSGNCGMCKKTIEGALKKEKAITKGKWDEETKKLTVTYDSEKITIEKIHQLVADAGYDTDKVKAKDEVYNKLHGCCKYDRKK